MVEWSDEAIILENKKYNETANIITILSRNYGLYNSILKYPYAQSNRTIFQIGNVIKANWYAKISEQMGSLKGEIEKNIAANIFGSKLGILIIGSASYIIKNSLIERQQEKGVYNSLYNLLVNINKNDELVWNYFKLEEIILKKSGYALDYSKCAVTDLKKDLYYLSPKTGKAVSKEIGDPYAEKLFILPKFMIDPQAEIINKDLINGLNITGYFIEKHLLSPKSLSLPHSRKIIIELI